MGRNVSLSDCCLVMRSTVGDFKMMACLAPVALYLLCGSNFVVDAFVLTGPCTKAIRWSGETSRCRSSSCRYECRGRDEESREEDSWTRREALRSTVAATAALIGPVNSASALEMPSMLQPEYARWDGGVYRPAKRCTAYLVDSTIPPTLIPFKAQREASILKKLGMGSGTRKAPFMEDSINLNNMLNKAVFGTLDALAGLAGTLTASSDGRPANYQSFVFLGANFDAVTSIEGAAAKGDADLAVDLMTDICRPREREANTAIALAFAPQSAQPAFDAFLSSDGSPQARDQLLASFRSFGDDVYQTARAHAPILAFAHAKRYPLLALAPELSDLDTVRKGGLQTLDPDRRDLYVADAQGFIALTQDPKFKLYTERSLLKDFRPSPNLADGDKLERGNFFAERILVHEAAATAISRWAVERPNSLVITVAPIPDVRFMGGINGRIPRICQFLSQDSLVDEEAVTTILLNPNAKETLSESRFLRLEIGTAPDTWAYQTKIADYFWFSTMPKVNMLPRMMNPQ